MEKFIHLGEKCGLEGEKLLAFVRETQELEREKKRLKEEKEARNVGSSLRKKREKRDADDKMKKGKREVRKEKLGNYNRKRTS